ncbi:hypothetical protein V2G26_012213 [Clonostachys chloroleuca]
MARLRREKNKDARKGRKNRETGIIKKLNTLVRLYDGEAVLFIRRPSGHYRGYQSRKGLVAMLPDVIDEAKLQGPDDFPTPGRDEGDDERMESIEEQGEQEDQDQDLPDCFDSENPVWMDAPHEPEQVPLEPPLQVNNSFSDQFQFPTSPFPERFSLLTPPRSTTTSQPDFVAFPLPTFSSAGVSSSSNDSHPSRVPSADPPALSLLQPKPLSLQKKKAILSLLRSSFGHEA